MSYEANERKMQTSLIREGALSVNVGTTGIYLSGMFHGKETRAQTYQVLFIVPFIHLSSDQPSEWKGMKSMPLSVMSSIYWRHPKLLLQALRGEQAGVAL